MEGASIELQEIALVSLYNNTQLLSKCVEYITEDFFNKPSYKIIYKCIKNYYKKYMIVPTYNELCILINDNYNDDYGNIDDIKSDAGSIIKQKISSEDYAYEKVTEFIRRARVEESLGRIVDSIKGGKINLDQVAVDLRDSIMLDITQTEFYNLADISSIRQIREEALGCTGSPIIVKFFIDGVNELMQYGGQIPGTVTMVIAPPGRGKTTLGICQGVSSAQQGYKVLHIFLGDMTKYDGLLRYSSSFTGIPTKDLTKCTDEQLGRFIQKNNYNGQFSNIDIISFAAGEKTASQITEEITNRQKALNAHYDVIIVDYDENVANETASDSMYEIGGSLYNKLALLAVMNKSVVFVMSQPKTTYWSSDIIPLEGASESSKKQKIVDMMISLSKPSKDSSVGSMYIAKNRRGIDCKIFRLGIDGGKCQMRHISELEYTSITQTESRKNNESSQS